MKLADALPGFSRELAEGLADEGRPDLADSVYSIEIIDRCICEVSGCITFHAVPKTTAPKWPDECERIIPCVKGVSCVHFVDHRIVWVEAFGRVDDKTRLEQLEKLAGINGGIGEPADAGESPS